LESFDVAAVLKKWAALSTILLIAFWIFSFTDSPYCLMDSIDRGSSWVRTATKDVALNENVKMSGRLSTKVEVEAAEKVHSSVKCFNSLV
jgi:hypothetical protein